jgi:hypothetical protein
LEPYCGGISKRPTDGKGLNIQIDAIPLDGRLTLRVVSEAKE